jgi:hypothetical protein
MAHDAETLLEGCVLRSDDDRNKNDAEEASIKEGSAQAAQDASCLSNACGKLSDLLGLDADSTTTARFSLFAPGSAALDDSSLLLSPGSGIALRLIAFSILAYGGLNSAVFALTPNTRTLSEYEHWAVVVTLSIQVASLLHDALARQRISISERDTHSCIVIVKVLAALSNAMLCFLPSTPFLDDLVTGRPNSMLRWAEWVVLAFTITFIVEALDSTKARTPLLVGASQSLSTLCGLFLPPASALSPLGGLPAAWALLLVVSFLLYFVLFARLVSKHRKLQRMRVSLPSGCYPLVRAELGMRLFWAMMFTWTGLTAVWTADAIMGRFVARGATSWAFVADCVIDCVAKALYTTAIMEQADTATQQADMQKEAKKRARLHW